MYQLGVDVLDEYGIGRMQRVKQKMCVIQIRALCCYMLPGVKSFKSVTVVGVVNGKSLPAHEAHFIDLVLEFKTGILLWLLL